MNSVVGTYHEHVPSQRGITGIVLEVEPLDKHKLLRYDDVLVRIRSTLAEPQDFR